MRSCVAMYYYCCVVYAWNEESRARVLRVGALCDGWYFRETFYACCIEQLSLSLSLSYVLLLGAALVGASVVDFLEFDLVLRNMRPCFVSSSSLESTVLHN